MTEQEAIELFRGRISLWTPGERLVDWVIVGGESRPGQPALQPEREWVEELLAWADVVQMPVYVKSNVVWPESERRQEWPERRGDLTVAAPVVVQGALF